MSINRAGLVEDDPRLSAYYSGIVADAPDLELAFAVSTLAEGLRLTEAHKPNILLVDLGLPDGNGLDLVRTVKASGETKVLVLTVLGDRATVMAALTAGADSYILKSSKEDEMLTHIRQTLSGFTPVSAQVATYLLELLRPRRAAVPADPSNALSERESEVLAVFSRGLTYEETGHALKISANTVRDYVKKIYAKLKVHSRSEALFEAQNLGLIPPGSPNKKV